MKKSIFVIMLMAFSFSMMAQSPLPKGGTQLNAGFGLDDEGELPVYAGVDFGIANNLTLGPYVGISGEYVSITGNLNYHFDELFGLDPDWNIYAGINAGFVSDTNDDNGDNDDGFGIGAQLGARYFFSDNIGVNLEAGGGNQVSGGKLGITVVF